MSILYKEVKTIFSIFLVSLIAFSCGGIQRIKYWGKDVEFIDGVQVTLLNDSKLKDPNTPDYFKNTKVFVSGLEYEKHYFYYIFWSNGRVFYSALREKIGVSLRSVLNNKIGSAGYYNIEGDILTTEFYSDRVYIYNSYKIHGNNLSETGQKGRKPFQKRIYKYKLRNYSVMTEKYTTTGSDSVFLNKDSVCIWSPFW